jgi:hypothetical protein
MRSTDQTAVSTKETIEVIYRHVAQLELVKMIHDALHDVEFECLRNMEVEGLGQWVKSRRQRDRHDAGFAGQRKIILARMQGETIDRDLRLDLQDRLASTAEAFQTAISAPSKTSYDNVLGERSRRCKFTTPRPAPIPRTASARPSDRRSAAPRC